ncbi:hypothetical protein ACFSCX_15770 [Bacillus salitolerans]|uniref:DUF4181 domain-containing protein n=1 Tax=Bacillus salitolerans TaxID=1437434 RepID=A0ABW4LV33_9BACI
MKKKVISIVVFIVWIAFLQLLFFRYDEKLARQLLSLTIIGMVIRHAIQLYKQKKMYYFIFNVIVVIAFIILFISWYVV